MEYYIKLGIIVIPFAFLLWRAIKLAKYVDELERTFLSFINLLENTKDKDLIIDYTKKTDIYKKIELNKR